MTENGPGRIAREAEAKAQFLNRINGKLKEEIGGLEKRLEAAIAAIGAAGTYLPPERIASIREHSARLATKLRELPKPAIEAVQDTDGTREENFRLKMSNAQEFICALNATRANAFHWLADEAHRECQSIQLLQQKLSRLAEHERQYCERVDEAETEHLSLSTSEINLDTQQIRECEARIASLRLALQNTRQGISDRTLSLDRHRSALERLIGEFPASGELEDSKDHLEIELWTDSIRKILFETEGVCIPTELPITTVRRHISRKPISGIAILVALGLMISGYLYYPRWKFERVVDTALSHPFLRRYLNNNQKKEIRSAKDEDDLRYLVKKEAEKADYRAIFNDLNAIFQHHRPFRVALDATPRQVHISLDGETYKIMQKAFGEKIAVKQEFTFSVRDFIERDHPISSEWDHVGGAPRSVSDGSYFRAAPLSTFLADSAR